jgi:hypothetical protein
MLHRAGIVRLLAAFTTCSMLAAQASFDWHEAHVLGSRGYVTMAYDPVRERTVLFDGDTWEWNGQAWAWRASSPTGWHEMTAMTWHAGRQRCVGLVMRAALTMELWEWDGSTWSQLASPHAPPMAWAMTYDWVRARLVAFVMSNSLSETWEWDGSDWQRVLTAHAPSPRTTSIAYDPLRQRTVLFGGFWRPSLLGGDFYYDDTWEYDGTDWTLVSQGGPSPRYLHGMVFDWGRQCVLMHGGGRSLTYVNDTWAWNGTAWIPVATPRVPLPRAGFGLAYDMARQRAVRCGGSDGVTDVFDTWELDPTDWVQTTEASPSLGSGTALAYDSTHSLLVLFGGSRSNGETWEWDGMQWQQMRVTSPARPAARSYCTMAYDAARQRTVMCGGSNSQGWLTDTWTWDGSNWVQMAASSPGGAYATMTYDEARQRCVLWSGSTYEWDGVQWTQTSRGIGTPAAITYDVARQNTVLVSGQRQLSTSIYNGSGWTLLSPPVSPSGLMDLAMTYDRARQRAVLTGTPINGSSLQTWYWDGITWSQASTATVPPGWRMGGLAYDQARGEVVLFSSRDFAQTWLLGPTVPASATDYGSGCGSSGIAPLLAGGLPYRGNEAFSMELRRTAPSSACVFGASLAAQNAALGSGCSLLLQSPVVLMLAVTNAAGVGTLTTAIPTPQSWRGVTLYWQAAVLDPSGPLGGVSLSQGRRTVVGD